MKRMLLGVLICVSLSLAFSDFCVNNKSFAAAYGFIGHEGLAIGEEPATGFASPAEARAIIQDIMDAVGIKAAFEVRAAKIPNAAAAIAKGKRYILYNPSFIAAIQKATGSNRWAPISILAHEIGHHLNGHTLTGDGSQHKIELEADEFSGFVLRRMGADLEDAQLAMRLASSKYASRTHPARGDRLIAIANGWERADAQLVNVPTKTAKADQSPLEQSADTEVPAVLSEKYIAYDVHFTADPKSTYYVTVRNNLVKLSGNKLFVLGKLLSTDNEAYPLALKTGNELLLVSYKGHVVTSTGRKLGYVRTHKADLRAS